MEEKELTPEEIKTIEWMVRPCETYKEEYADCTSIKGRFHQYFIHGQTTDCTPWQRDHDNCLKWENEKNLKSLKEIVTNEEKRRNDRLLAHYKNTVWKKRETPPPDWNKPLPDYIQKDYEHTYLALKAKELEDEKDGKFNELSNRTLCSIL